MGVLPSAVGHHDGVTYLGEYPLSQNSTPYVLVSNDYGRSWSRFASLPNVRHIHSVQWDPYSGDFWITTGDKDSESQIGRLTDGAFEPVGGGSQTWRAVELAFTPNAILWGMDCAYLEDKRILKLQREEIHNDNPSPVTVGQVPGSVYYSATLTLNDDQWIAFSTAMEVGRDSTGPTTQAAPTTNGIVIAASESSGFTDWIQLASFQRRRVLTDHLPGNFPRANGYVFLAADPERGLLVNPYNTSFDDVVIRQYSPEQIVSLSNRCSNE
jgi:hypothetical protein